MKSEKAVARAHGDATNVERRPPILLWGLASLFVVLTVALIAVLGTGRSPTRTTASTTAAGSAEPAPPHGRSDVPGPTTPRSWGADPLSGAAGVSIDDVQVDKREICRGEEAIVSIRARALDGHAEQLSFGAIEDPELVGPRFTLRPRTTVAAGMMRVFARGSSGLLVAAEVPSITVRDCDAPVSVTVGYRRSAAMMDRAWLTAEVGGPKGSAGERPWTPTTYVWDFGDGKRETTASPTVEHSYEGRLQNASYSYFFVTVTARDSRAHEARGTRSLRFVNLGFTLPDSPSKVRVFTGIDQGAAGGERIWLYHGHGQKVRFDKVIVKTVAPGPEGSESVTSTEEHRAADLLGFSELSPGESRTVRDLSSLRPKTADVVRMLTLSGRSEDGKGVVGEFDLLGPQPAVAATAMGDDAAWPQEED